MNPDIQPQMSSQQPPSHPESQASIPPPQPPGPSYRGQHILAIVIIGLFLIGGVIFVYPKLLTWYAEKTAFTQQENEQRQKEKDQKASGSPVYKLAATPTVVRKNPPVSIRLPEGWSVTHSAEADDATAIGPADYLHGRIQPAIEATASSIYQPSLEAVVAGFKFEHSVPKELISEKTTVAAGIPTYVLEYKTPDRLGLKKGEAPTVFHHMLVQMTLKNKTLYTVQMDVDDRDFAAISPMFAEAAQSFSY